MKSILFFLVICFSTCAFASEEPTHFYDENSGISVLIPEGFKKTWNVNNQQNGMNFTVFNTDEDLDCCSVVVLGQMPLHLLAGCNEEDCMEFVMNQINMIPLGEFNIDQQAAPFLESENVDVSNMGINVEDECIECEDFKCEILQLEDKNFDQFTTKHFRFTMKLGEGECESLSSDLHIFLDEQYLYIVVATSANDKELEELEELSHTVVKSVKFLD